MPPAKTAWGIHSVQIHSYKAVNLTLASPETCHKLFRYRETTSRSLQTTRQTIKDQNEGAECRLQYIFQSEKMGKWKSGKKVERRPHLESDVFPLFRFNRQQPIRSSFMFHGPVLLLYHVVVPVVPCLWIICGMCPAKLGSNQLCCISFSHAVIMS